MSVPGGTRRLRTCMRSLVSCCWERGWTPGSRLRTTTEDGSLPSGRASGIRYGRHERWGTMVKRSGMAGELRT